MIKIGDVLDGVYEITEKIGFGGGGIIFKANHLRMQKTVALKLIKEDVKGIIENRKEVDILKNLKNDFLPQVLDFVEDGSDVYTVMEYIEGQNLGELVNSGKQFDEKSIIKYAVQLCSAVEYLHNQNPPIIHSDIKPANIMLTNKDNICLIDFNISSIYKESKTYSIGGSKGFAAPEQFRQIIDVPTYIDEFHEETRYINDDIAKTMIEYESTATLVDYGTELISTTNQVNVSNEPLTAPTKDLNKAYIDTRTDIYGIGASLYYIVTSRLPAKGKFDFRGIKISKRLRKIIEKAMAQNPDDRYRDVSEMKADIENNGSIKLNFKALIAASCAVIAVITTIILYPIIHVEMNTKAVAYSYGNEFVIEKSNDKEILGKKLSNKYNATAVSLMQQLYNYYYSLGFDECSKYISVNQEVIDKFEKVAKDNPNVKFNTNYKSVGGINKLNPDSGEIYEYLYNNFTNYTGKDDLYIYYSVNDGKITRLYVSDDSNLYEAITNGVDIQGHIGLAETVAINDVGISDIDSSVLDIILSINSLDVDLSPIEISGVYDDFDFPELPEVPSFEGVYADGLASDSSEDLGEPVEVNGRTYFTSSEEITLSGTILHGADFSSLTKFPYLKKISFWSSPTGVDISMFPTLPNIEEIDLSGSDIITLEGIDIKFPNLKTLNISATDINDLTPISNLKSLQNLDIGLCPSISDLSALSHLTDLKSLDIGDCELISDISQLSGLKNMEVLDISGISFNDSSFIDVIGQFNNLKSLDAQSVKYISINESDGNERRNAITDISSFERLIDLEELNLIGSEVSDISALSNLKKIKKLYIDSKNIADYSAIRNMSDLEVLNITIGYNADISILKNHIRIKELKIYLVENYIDEEYLYPYINTTELMSYVSQMKSLESLSLCYVSLSDLDIESICNITSLKSLYLVTDISEEQKKVINDSLSAQNCSVIIHIDEFKSASGNTTYQYNDDYILYQNIDDDFLYILNEVLEGNEIDRTLINPEYSYSNFNDVENFSIEAQLSNYCGQYLKDFSGWTAGVLFMPNCSYPNIHDECVNNAKKFLDEKFPNEDDNTRACLIIYDDGFYVYMGDSIQEMADYNEGVDNNSTIMTEYLNNSEYIAEMILYYYYVLFYYSY